MLGRVSCALQPILAHDNSRAIGKLLNHIGQGLTHFQPPLLGTQQPPLIRTSDSPSLTESRLSLITFTLPSLSEMTISAVLGGILDLSLIHISEPTRPY